MSGHNQSIATALTGLRAEIGDIEFGYRTQGFFAHVLNRIGGRVLEIRHQGHTDIVATISGRLGRFEIEIASANDRHHTIKSDDLLSIKPDRHSDVGFLAVLDAMYPVRWAVIEYSRIEKRLARWPLATLHAIADLEMSRQCTAAFCQILSENTPRLETLTFHLLCDRALRGSDAKLS